MKLQNLIVACLLALAVTSLVGCGESVDEKAGKVPDAAQQTALSGYAKAKEVFKRADGKFEAMTPEDRTWFVDVYSKGNLREAEMTWAQISQSDVR